MSLEHPGGDTRTSSAKQATARREEQIVALKLRHHSYSAIARVVGISRQSAQKAFLRALHRNTAAQRSTLKLSPASSRISLRSTDFLRRHSTDI
jgi:DNA-binding CsgD family transcriptional regulator